MMKGAVPRVRAQASQDVRQARLRGGQDVWGMVGPIPNTGRFTHYPTARKMQGINWCVSVDKRSPAGCIDVYQHRMLPRHRCVGALFRNAACDCWPNTAATLPSSPPSTASSPGPARRGSSTSEPILTRSSVATHTIWCTRVTRAACTRPSVSCPQPPSPPSPAPCRTTDSGPADT